MRRKLAHRANRIATVGRFSDDLDTRVLRQQGAQPGPEQGVVIDDKYALCFVHHWLSNVLIQAMQAENRSGIW